jgi:hypothetical protein
MEPKIKILIDNLLAKTKKRETKWDRVGKSDQFILFLDNARVSIDKLISNKRQLFYKFSIINSSGDTILNVNGIKDDNAFAVHLDNDYNTLKELHQEIQKAYFKVNETIDGLLGEIEKDGEIGNEDPDSLPF